MPYTITPYDDGRIIVMKMDSAFDFHDEFNQFAVEAAALMDESAEPMVLITDSRERSIKHLNDLIQGGGLAIRAEGKRMLNHPNLKKMFEITSSKAIQMTIKGLNSATFGFVEISVFETLEEALNAARNLLYGQRQTGTDS